jgi:hypothetical protein
MRILLPLIALLLVCSVTAVAGTPIVNPPPPRTPDLRPSRPVVLTGDLGQLRVAVNGEFSGWVLIKPERSFNLNVTAVLGQARALSGHRVVIRGFLTQGHFLDGTPFQQVRVVSIARAP